MSTEEDKATANGWTPRDQFKGNDEDFISAREFNTRGDMIGQIKAAKQDAKRVADELMEVKGTLSELSEHHKKTADRVRSETIAELKELKKLAIKEGDGETVVNIDEQLDEHKAAAAAEVSQRASEPTVHPEIAAFQAEHTYIEESPVLSGAMLGVAQAYKAENPDASPKEVLEAALEQVKEDLPQYFDEQTSDTQVVQKKASKTIEGRTRSPARKSKGVTAADLDETQTEMGKKFVKMETFKNLDEYAAELAANGDL